MKRPAGFSLLEALISLVILSSSLLIVFGYYNSMLNRLVRIKNTMPRMLVVKNNVIKRTNAALLKDQNFPEKVTIETPEMSLVVEQRAISKKSSLKEFADNCSQIMAQGTWSEGAKTSREKSYSHLAFALYPMKKES